MRFLTKKRKKGRRGIRKSSYLIIFKYQSSNFDNTTIVDWVVTVFAKNNVNVIH